jgi:hypothetical protein
MLKVTLWNGDTAFLATRYEDVRFVLGSSAFSSVPTRPGYPFISESLQRLFTGERPPFTLMDGEEHLRQRRMISGLSYGGYKHSGNGRSGGMVGLHQFQQIKTIRVAVPPAQSSDRKFARW